MFMPIHLFWCEFVKCQVSVVDFVLIICSNLPSEPNTGKGRSKKPFLTVMSDSSMYCSANIALSFVLQLSLNVRETLHMCSATEAFLCAESSHFPKDFYSHKIKCFLNPLLQKQELFLKGSQPINAYSK